MSHQKRVALAAKQLKDAKINAKLKAKAEAAKVYKAVLEVENKRAQAEYMVAITKKGLTLEERLDAEGWTIEEDDE